jgi:hypothetical protein
MDTKTGKQMALALLALDELTDSESAWLNYATMEQAYPGLKERWEATGTSTPILTPDYCWSVNDCLMLELPTGYRWVLVSPMPASEYKVGWAIITKASQAEARDMQRGKTLPLAMLAAWWQLQPD